MKDPNGIPLKVAGFFVVFIGWGVGWYAARGLVGIPKVAIGWTVGVTVWWAMVSILVILCFEPSSSAVDRLSVWWRISHWPMLFLSLWPFWGMFSIVPAVSVAIGDYLWGIIGQGIVVALWCVALWRGALLPIARWYLRRSEMTRMLGWLAS